MLITINHVIIVRMHAISLRDSAEFFYETFPAFPEQFCFRILLNNCFSLHFYLWKQLNFAKLLEPAISCSKLTIETLEQGAKYLQS